MSDLEYQVATLAARHAGLWIAGAQVLVGVLQCAVVAWGIRAMVRANNERAVSAAEDRREAREDREAARRETTAAADRARREADQRHAEAMAAITAQNRHVDTQSAALAEAVAALKVVVERTTPEAAQ